MQSNNFNNSKFFDITKSSITIKVFSNENKENLNPFIFMESQKTINISRTKSERFFISDFSSTRKTSIEEEKKEFSLFLDKEQETDKVELFHVKEHVLNFLADNPFLQRNNSKEEPKNSIFEKKFMDENSEASTSGSLNSSAVFEETPLETSILNEGRVLKDITEKYVPSKKTKLPPKRKTKKNKKIINKFKMKQIRM